MIADCWDPQQTISQPYYYVGTNKIIIYIDHNHLSFTKLATDHVHCWRLIIAEYGPMRFFISMVRIKAWLTHCLVYLRWSFTNFTTDYVHCWRLIIAEYGPMRFFISKVRIKAWLTHSCLVYLRGSFTNFTTDYVHCWRLIILRSTVLWDFLYE